MTTILVTGGTGYIGSHTVIELLNSGFEVIIVDNLSNSSIEVLDRIKAITNKIVKFYKADITNKNSLTEIFFKNKIDGVIHFSALKAVGESVIKPIIYYNNNILGSIVLLEVMKEFNVKTLIFSSSATVYGNADSSPITESFPLKPTNPYAQTKVMIEQLLRDVFTSDNEWNIAILRYFNPIGAHYSGLIGEDPTGTPNNLLPYITQVAIGKLPFLKIFGNDYTTPDGTGIRDYIHVVDLALGHIQALNYFIENKNQILTINLGTGVGYSVLEVVKAFENIVKIHIPYKFLPRRPGDIDRCFAEVGLAKKLLNWQARLDIVSMCRDNWNWQKQNPSGYNLNM